MAGVILLAPIPAADEVATGTFNALNAAVTVALAGKRSVGFQLSTGTLAATIVPELSYDGGTTWLGAYFDDPASETKFAFAVFANPNALFVRSILLAGGASHARVRVSAYTSGSASAAIRATDVDDSSLASEGGAGGVPPPAVVQVGGLDRANNKLRPLGVNSLGLLGTLTAAEAIGTGLAAGVVGTISGKVTTAALTPVVVRNSTYVEQSSGAQRSIVSASASDGAAGTGIRTVRLTYYTLAAGVIAGPFAEDLALNGTTPVNTTATNICYVDSIEALTAGSGGVAAGNIDLRTATGGGGSTFARIATGDRRTYYAHHYVATGATCVVSSFYASNTAASGNTPDFAIRRRDPTISAAAEIDVCQPVEVQGSTGALQISFDVPRVIQGPAQILVYVTPNNTASQLSRFEASYLEASP